MTPQQSAPAPIQAKAGITEPLKTATASIFLFFIGWIAVASGSLAFMVGLGEHGPVQDSLLEFGFAAFLAGVSVIGLGSAVDLLSRIEHRLSREPR